MPSLRAPRALAEWGYFIVLLEREDYLSSSPVPDGADAYPACKSLFLHRTLPALLMHLRRGLIPVHCQLRYG